MNWTISAHIHQPQIDESNPHTNAAAYGSTSCFLADSRLLKAYAWHIRFVGPITIQYPVQHTFSLENNLAEITVNYESGWNKYTENFYAKTEWPEAELITPLVNDSSYSLVCPFFFESRWDTCSFSHSQILFSSSCIANSTTVMYILAFSPTSTIDSIHTKIVVNFSITALYNFKKWHLTCYRFWRTCTTWTAGTMAIGYHRRIYL